MKPKFSLILLVSLFIFSCKDDDDDPQPQPPQTQTVNLQNDGFDTGDAVAFQSAFISGEMAAVTLGTAINDFKLTSVEFLLGGTLVPQTKNVTLRIYADSGGISPDSLMYVDIHTLVSSDDVLQEIDLSDMNLQFTGGSLFRVSLDAGDGLPGVAIDDDGTIDPLGNWIFSGGSWMSAYTAGLNGDFIIRAVVEEDL